MSIANRILDFLFREYHRMQYREDERAPSPPTELDPARAHRGGDLLRAPPAAAPELDPYLRAACRSPSIPPIEWPSKEGIAMPPTPEEWARHVLRHAEALRELDGEREDEAGRDAQDEARALSELRRAHHADRGDEPGSCIGRWQARWRRLTEEVERAAGPFERAYLQGLRDAYNVASRELVRLKEAEPSPPRRRAGVERLERAVEAREGLYDASVFRHDVIEALDEMRRPALPTEDGCKPAEPPSPAQVLDVLARSPSGAAALRRSVSALRAACLNSTADKLERLQIGPTEALSRVNAWPLSEKPQAADVACRTELETAARLEGEMARTLAGEDADHAEEVSR